MLFNICGCIHVCVMYKYVYDYNKCTTYLCGLLLVIRVYVRGVGAGVLGFAEYWEKDLDVV